MASKPRVLLVYASRFGTTREAVDHLLPLLPTSPDLVELTTVGAQVDPAAYDTVLVGGSIYMGRIQKQIRQYLSTYATTLQSKQLGLFLCCLYEGNKAQEQFQLAFPSALREQAVAFGLFGGIAPLEKANFLERLLLRHVPPAAPVYQRLDKEAIEKFARDLVQAGVI